MNKVHFENPHRYMDCLRETYMYHIIIFLTLTGGIQFQTFCCGGAGRSSRAEPPTAEDELLVLLRRLPVSRAAAQANDRLLLRLLAPRSRRGSHAVDRGGADVEVEPEDGHPDGAHDHVGGGGEDEVRGRAHGDAQDAVVEVRVAVEVRVVDGVEERVSAEALAVAVVHHSVVVGAPLERLGPGGIHGVHVGAVVDHLVVDWAGRWDYTLQLAPKCWKRVQCGR